MRVISQDGMLDFPYELSAIRINNEVITMSMCEETAYRNVVARYSAEAKAVKAMEMLREKYLENSKMSTGSAWTCEIVSLAKVFRFPQDDEIEV